MNPAPDHFPIQTQHWGPGTKVIIVTGCDSAHYELAIDLINSLTDAGRVGLTVGFVHVGDDAVPSAIESAVDCMVHVADDVFIANQLSGSRLAYLMIKARLPEFFPGYDIYVWLDGDTWVQNRIGLYQIIQCAHFADMCAHPELDPNYFRERIPSALLLRFYGALYGDEEAEKHVGMPMFNCGVLAARGSSPMWALWREALLSVRRTMAEPGMRFSDQVPMHRLITTGQLSVHPLKGINNWLTHAALPSVNLEYKRLMTSFYPNEEINIIHLTWVSKETKYLLPDGRETTLRYRDIKALFKS